MEVRSTISWIPCHDDQAVPKFNMTQEEDSIQKPNITFEEKDKYTDLHLVTFIHFKMGQG